MSALPSRDRASRDERQGGHVAEMQRRRLVLAVGEVAGEIGIEDASVGRICKRAGVSRRTFYDLFDDREGCLLAALDQSIARMTSILRSAIRDEARWASRVRVALTALLEYFDAHPEDARMCVVESLKGGPAVLARRREVLAALAVAVDEGRRHSRGNVEVLPLTAEGVVGGALAVVCERLQADRDPELAALAGALCGMIVRPYLGDAMARRELERPSPSLPGAAVAHAPDPFAGIAIRFTYRTARVLAAIDSEPGASNRAVADRAGIADDGQMSRLLRRLESAGLIENRGERLGRGEPNVWHLSGRGSAIHATLAGDSGAERRELHAAVRV